MRVTFLALAALLTCTSALLCQDRKIVCYWGSWSVYRTGNGNFNTTNIATKYCTHLIYAFAGINNNSTMLVLDPQADLPDGGGKNGYALFNQLREKKRGLKTLIAVGGWNEGSIKFSLMASTAESRKIFIESAVAFVKKHGFNGLDLGWEYPTERGGLAADKENFVLLLKEMRTRFDQEELILTAALAAAETQASKYYSIKEVSKYLHFINLMAYDYHVGSENKTGQNAPLYAGSWEKGNETLLNLNASLNYWISQGAHRAKLVLGMPFYGHSFTLADANNSRIGAPAIPPIPDIVPGDTERVQRVGTLAYSEICQLLKNDTTWEITFDEEQRTPYAVRNSEWIGYDDVRSIREKALLAKKLKLGGAMLWSLESEDFRGLCGRRNSLLKTVNQVLRKCPFPLSYLRWW